MSNRTKALIGGGITIVVLAGVILGLSAISSPSKDSSVPPTITLSPGQQSSQAVAAGDSALASGDTTQAVKDYNRAIVIDPANATAKAKLAAAQAGSSSASTKDSGSSSSKTPAVTLVKADWTQLPLNSLKVLLPTKYASYTVGSPVEVGSDAVVSATAADAGKGAQHVEWSVHDRKTSSDAMAFVDTADKKLYPKNAAQVTVSGTSAYFGTDGTQFATIVYRRGRYVFQVVLNAPGASPATLQTQAEQAAAAFPTAP